MKPGFLKDALFLTAIEAVAPHPEGQKALVTTRQAKRPTALEPQHQLWLCSHSHPPILIVSPLSTESSIGFAAWHPDGRSFSFITRQGLQFGLWVQSDDGSSPTPLHHQETPIVWQSWSPDGKRIAFVQETVPEKSLCYAKGTFRKRYQLWVTSVAEDNMAPTLLSLPSEHVGSFFGFAGAHWSPDGEFLVYAHSEELVLHDWRVSLTLLNLSTQKRVSFLNAEERGFNPHFSPSGQKIAFVQERSGSFATDACIAIFDIPTQAILSRFSTPDAYPDFLLGWQNEEHVLFYENHKTHKRIGRLNVLHGTVGWLDT